jgi:dTDP-4-dehydrorhamnose reductase
MPKNILITGGSGLLALNWAVTVRDHCGVVLGLHERAVTLPGVKTQRINLESADAIARTLEASQIDLVIHTAGFTNVEECEAKPDLARHINVTLADNVAKACAETGISLAHISTDHLFSGAESLVDESHPISPQNSYGRTKAEAECQVLETNAKALVVRTNFYGWGSSYRRSFSDTILGVLRSGKEATLFTDVFYTPILIEVLAEAVLDLIQLEASGVYNVVGDERLSKHEFGLKVAETFGLDAALIKSVLMAEQASLVRRPFDMSLSNQRVCKVLGRPLGGVNEQIARLRQQEQNGLAQELYRL